MRTMATVKNRRRSSGRRGERGQAIILFVGLITVIFVIAAIVIDFGLWLGERRAVQRAADLAALAGSQDLLSREDALLANALAIDNAHKWARDNGFNGGDPDVEVTVELLCANTLSNPPPGVCINTNPPGSGPSTCSLGSPCDSLRVTISKPANHLFTSIFGIGGVRVSSSATAGAEVDLVAMDTVVLLDATGSMGAPPCDDAQSNAPCCDSTQSNDGCPIKEARDAANSFVDILLGGSSDRSQVGYAPYNHCYNPPIGDPADRVAHCVPAANAIDLTIDADALHAGINATTAQAQTNLCLPLLRALDMLSGLGAQPGGMRQSVVLLADGDNNYNRWAYSKNLDYPPPECRPSTPSEGEGAPAACLWPRAQERELDIKTWQVANRLKEQGVEIYVVGLGVCGSEDGWSASDPGYCSSIGDREHDNAADQRLLKCIASSPDHYFRVASAQDLPAIFQTVAWEIAARGLLR